MKTTSSYVAYAYCRQFSLSKLCVASVDVLCFCPWKRARIKQKKVYRKWPVCLVFKILNSFFILLIQTVVYLEFDIRTNAHSFGYIQWYRYIYLNINSLSFRMMLLMGLCWFLAYLKPYVHFIMCFFFLFLWTWIGIGIMISEACVLLMISSSLIV